jgi:CheY-like chemotaxis protein
VRASQGRVGRVRLCAANVSALTPSRLDGLNILIVDDDHQDTVEMFVAYLGTFGADAVGTNTARAGIHFATTRALDAVHDLKMRVEDGWWFLRELRALRNANAKVPVFAISADHNQEQTAMLGGFQAFFLKPVDCDVLLVHLAALPGRRR